MVSAADKAPLWRKMEKMNMRDLSRDDDFLSSMLIESLGTGDEPLTVHKMDLTHKIPAHEPTEVLEIVQKYIVHGKSSRSSSNRIKQAVDALLQLSPVKGYLRGKSESQRNGFATHASRYFELYMPGGSVEISRTHRYSHKTGKAELCIIATRNLAAGEVITDLKGSLADLTHTEDEMLRRKDSVTGRKDFSVIYSRHKKLSHLFLGPARFVNHDCQHNVQLFRDGRLVSFRVLKPIGFGQELTAHYGNSYFGRKNKDCLCETCERNKVGGYAPRLEGDDPDVSDSDISETSEIDRSARFWDVGEQEGRANLHERRTRRGTYALDARHARQLSLPVTGNTAIEPAAAVIQELDAEAVAQSLEGVAARRAAEAAAEAVDAVMRAAEAATVAAEAAVQAVAATESTSSTSGTLVNSSTTPETIVSTLSSLSELDGVDVEMNDHPPCSPTPQPEPPSQPETALPPPRAPTPLCDIPLEPTPAAIKRIDLDTYKGNGLTAHFPPLVRIKDTEAVARLILARHDLGSKMTAHDLPSSAFHPLLEHALSAGKYPKISSDGQTLHFLASPALVDPKMTTYDFFDCGALAFPHTLVEITDKVAITAMILTRRDLQRRSNWQGLPWPEWSPLLAKAVKEGRYPHFPAIEKRGDPPVFYASLSLAGPVGRVHSLISPHPVGFDIPRHQLTFLNEYEWQHVRQQPEMYRLDHTCCWEGLPWPETNAPLLDNMYRAKKWPVFPEIDDRGAPPVLRLDRTYAVFESRIPRLISNTTFVHTASGYASVNANPPPPIYQVSREKWLRIIEQPDEFGLNAKSDWRGLPWPELSPTLGEAQLRGTYPIFPPSELRGAQPRSQDDCFSVFDASFRPVVRQAAKVAQEDASSSSGRSSSARSSTGPSTAPTSMISRATSSPTPAKKKKEKEPVTPARDPRDDGQPRCRTCWVLQPSPGDCTRCRRHLMIYGSPWPKREPPPGSRIRSPSPTPDASSASEQSSDNDGEDADEDDDENPDSLPDNAPPPKRKLGLHGKKRPAPTSLPISLSRPLKRRRTDPQYIADRAARTAAREAGADHADDEGGMHGLNLYEQRRLALHRAFKQQRRYFREQARLREAMLPKSRLGGLPTPQTLARRREERQTELQRRTDQELDETQDRLLTEESDGRIMDRIRHGGLFGARNPMFFNQQHSRWRQRQEERRWANPHEHVNRDDGDGTLHAYKEPVLHIPSSEAPPADKFPLAGSSRHVLASRTVQSFRIPLPPWMDGGDDPTSSLLVRIKP